MMAIKGVFNLCDIKERKSRLSFSCLFSSVIHRNDKHHPHNYLPFLFYLFDPSEGFIPLLLRVAPLSFTSDRTDGLSPRRVLEEPLISALEIGFDF